MPSFLIYTLGCKVNQYESQYVREGLERLGFREAGDGEKPDLCVINTCTVTAESDLKSRKIIRSLARQHPNASIVVMGCYAARSPKELADLPGVAQVIRDKADIPEWLRQLGLADPPQGISSFGGRCRAFVKVQDGCRQGCSYCIIPLVRPVLRSRPSEEVLEEIKRLVSAGYREIVLTGVHLGQYGVDLPTPRPSLVQLIEKILELPGDFRVRLSSLEAVEVGPELIIAMAGRPERVCPHLHLPLQSGSDRILEQMGRPYRLADFLRRWDQIHAHLDNPALTTDLLVGFPGETEADFQVTRRAVEKMGFSKLHVFPFSPRPGTRAAQLPNRVPPSVVRRRCAELAELGVQLRRRYLESLLGRKAQVLLEEPVETVETGGVNPLEGQKGQTVPGASKEGEIARIPYAFLDYGTSPKTPSNSGLNITRNSYASFPEPSQEVHGSLGKAEKTLFHVLRGTSERYVPVHLIGPRCLVGQLITVPVETCMQTGDEWVLWAASATGNLNPL